MSLQVLWGLDTDPIMYCSIYNGELRIGMHVQVFEWIVVQVLTMNY